MNIDQIERKALRVGILISSIMAISGWTAFYFSGSEATLLDGNFSFISVIATIVALSIAKRKHLKSMTFPFGSYVYEALFVLIKGILMLGIIAIAVIQNIKKIGDFLNGETIEQVEIDIILIYVAVVIVLSFTLYFYNRRSANAIDNKSPILKVETQSSLVDGLLSLAIGLAFLIIWIIPEESPFDFLKIIGDAIIVLIMCLFFFSMPFKIIKDSFIELSGGALQNKLVKEEIESVISRGTNPGFEVSNIFISKVGSSYFIGVFVSSKTGKINMDDIRLFKDRILEDLVQKYQNIQLEVIFFRIKSDHKLKINNNRRTNER